MDHWMILGDFNLIRSPNDRSRPGGNVSNMLLFNSTMQAHNLVEIPLKGRSFTWSNMQENPLLEKLDWVFTNADWTISFPNTIACPLAKVTSDHTPIHIKIGSDIPKASIFRFENYWMDFDGFYDTVYKSWNSRDTLYNSANDVSARFKCPRQGLKQWSRKLSRLNSIIENCNYVMTLMDGFEEQRTLSLMERNFRKILKKHILKLVEAKRIYWKSRFKRRDIIFGDENSKLFHAMATMNYRKKLYIIHHHK